MKKDKWAQEVLDNRAARQVAAQAKKDMGKSKLSRIIVLKVRSSIPTSLGSCKIITEKVSGTGETMAPQATRRGRKIKLLLHLRNS